MTKQSDALNWCMGSIAVIPVIVTIVRCLKTGWGLAGTDVATQFLPWWQFSSRSILRGNLPWWDPSTMLGYPHLADPQSAFFYPLNWLLLLAPSIYSISFLVILHLMMGGGFLFFWLRSHGRSIPASLLASSVFVFSSGLTAHVHAGHFSMICALAWLPLALHLTEMSLLEGKTSRFVQLGICLGLQLLAGHPQTVVLTLIGCGIAALFSAYRSRILPTHIPLRLATVMLPAALIACAPLCLGWELTGQSARTSATNDLIARDALPVSHLCTFLIPDFQGGNDDVPYTGTATYHETLNYIGMLPLILVLIGWSRNPFAIALIIAGILLAVFPGFPSLHWHLLPIIGMFRGWARAMLLTSVGASILMAEGLDRVIAGTVTFKRIAAIGIILGFLLTTVAIVMNPLEASPLRTLIRHEFLRNLILLITSVLILRITHSRTFKAIGLLLIGLLMTADNTIGWMRFLAPRPVDDEAILRKIADDPTFQTIFNRNAAQANGRLLIHSLPESINKYFLLDADTIVGYRPLPLQPFEEFFSLADERAAETPAIYAFSTRKSRLFRMSGIAWRLALPDDIDPEGLHAIAPIGPAVLYHDPAAYPRAWTVGYSSVHSDRAERLNALMDPEWNPAQTAILEHPARLSYTPDNEPRSRTATIQFIDSQGSSDIRTDFERAGLVIVSDCWYPGWTATINGIPAPILRANHLFRAIEVPEGRCEITMRYRPGWRYVPVMITLLSMAVGAVWIGLRKQLT